MALITRQDVAERFKVGVWAVDDWVKAGYLPVVRVGRTVRFEEAKIEAIIANGGVSVSKAIPESGTAKVEG